MRTPLWNHVNGVIRLILYLFALLLVVCGSSTVPNSFVTHYTCYYLLVLCFASRSLHLLLSFICVTWFLFENYIDVLGEIVGWW